MSLASVPDGRLVALCRGGEEPAWAELVNRFSRYVYAIATQAFRLSEQDAEDVFQEVFARTYEHLEKLRDDDAIRPWIGQLTRRLCVDRLRLAVKEHPDADMPEPSGIDETLARLDEAIDVRQALEALSEDCREILDRFFARDESYQTIGRELELPIGTIGSRISRCLAKLRDELAGRKEPAGSSSGVRE
jgi:RNA polymerase sigma factor (sigma-70 family)